MLIRKLKTVSEVQQGTRQLPEMEYTKFNSQDPSDLVTSSHQHVRLFGHCIISQL